MNYTQATEEALKFYQSNSEKIDEILFREETKLKLDIREGFKSSDGVALYQIADTVSKPDAVFIEVGSWKGYSTSYLARVARRCGGRVYCVDHWKGSPGVPHHNIENCFEIFSHNMEALGLDKYVSPLVMDSLRASKEFEDETADLVFIDADHRYESIKQDLEIWYPKVKKGGILCGHDCEMYYENCNDKLKGLIDNNLKNDAIKSQFYIFSNNKNIEVSLHGGVVKALHEKFGSKYDIIKGTTVWLIQKEGNV